MLWNKAIGGLSWNNKIQLLRIIQGKTQEQLAKECLTNRKGWWNWETGKHYPRAINRQAIARALGVKTQDIFKKGESNSGNTGIENMGND